MVLGLLLAAQGLTSASHSLQVSMVQIAMPPRSWKLEAMSYQRCRDLVQGQISNPEHQKPCLVLLHFCGYGREEEREQTLAEVIKTVSGVQLVPNNCGE